VWPVRFPRILRWREDKSIRDADSLETIHQCWMHFKRSAMKNDPAASKTSPPRHRALSTPKNYHEKFPRILATRRIEDDGAEYFGAFLTKTAVRILMGFLNRKFRLRTCDIPIDGSFSVPCTQYYHRRCIAPCVESLCDRENYLEIVQLVRLFLSNRRRELVEDLTSRMDAAAGQLDFETAAYWRDLIKSIEKFWKKSAVECVVG
jgi:excinuclease UvrABC nuclease subunit